MWVLLTLDVDFANPVRFERWRGAAARPVFGR
jgi:hypothetical protein